VNMVWPGNHLEYLRQFKYYKPVRGNKRTFKKNHIIFNT
jgi:hypothetical protein